ncbi:GGDEF domain-containing protein [Lysobacter sp. TY2-98]|uniref:GGDEF domain-containing protein n=1 Tax=Lysobacter sp. TY2-98 TaxID=2290922 RepID=UPI000E2077DD|nr:GGDEF domain-containing protein [Lysobacter sp. TY2-98]AXK72594.1 GGDEF domain-containing protein [Lysobacter sp. TY2-98]
MDLIGQLDTATLAFVTGLAGLLLAGTMGGIRLAGMRSSALVFWGAAGLAAGIAHLLAHLTLGLGLDLPKRESLAVANGMVTLVHVLLLAGVRVFLGRRSYWMPMAVLALVTGSASYIVPDVWGVLRVRVLMLAPIYLVLDTAAGFMLWRAGSSRGERFQNLAAAAFLFNSAVLVVRIAHALLFDTPDGAFAREPFQTLVFVLGLVFISVLTMGLALLMFRSKELELRRLVHSDPLTGLFNRRSLYEYAQREQARSERYGTPLALVMVDIDGFKSVNDTYGHAAGDDVICETALRVACGLRDVDTAFRLGGEEFLLLLPSTSMVEATSVAERLRTAVCDTPIAAIGRAVTASFGVSELQRGREDWEAAMHRADVALYRAKDEGRNRVVAMPAPRADDAGVGASIDALLDVP